MSAPVTVADVVARVPGAPSAKWRGVFAALILVGIVAFGITVLANPQRAWAAMLVNLTYWLTLAQAGVVLAAVFYLVKAKWAVPFTRIALGTGRFLPWGFLLLAVTLLLGGPHLFSTYLATYLDPRFRRSHRWMLAGAAVLVPSFVVFMTFYDFQVLMSVFIFSASAHVLQQNAYIAGIYRLRAGRPEPAWSRGIDWAVLGLSFYPFAAFRLVRGR